MEKKEYTSPYDFEGKIPLKQAIILGLQHVLAMFVGNLTPVLILRELVLQRMMQMYLLQSKFRFYKMQCLLPVSLL